MVVVDLLIPNAAPLLGMIVIGNLFRVPGVGERLRKAASGELMNTATTLLGLGIGSTMRAKISLALPR